jgi:hypothetical protein
MKERLRKISAILILLQFIMFFVATNMFPHIHTEFGVQYFHSHPYSNPQNLPNSGHSHTQDEIKFIAITSSVVAVFAFLFFAISALIARVIRPKNRLSIQILYQRIIGTANSLRAPPVHAF